LSLRLVEEMLLERGIVVSYETIRCWAKKFGPDYTCRLRRKAPSPNDVWHLDEVVVTISGRRHWLWRAVQDEGLLDAWAVHAAAPKALNGDRLDRQDRMSHHIDNFESTKIHHPSRAPS
jgi:transposase-like protein